jgi:hypothetical protein
VLKQQQEQNIQHQKECPGVADNQCQKPKNCTVVENGRVVVKPLQPPVNEQTQGTQPT